MVGGGRDAASRLQPHVPGPPSGHEIAEPRCSSRALGFSLVRVASCSPRPLRRLPVGPGRYLSYRGGRRKRSCPTRTATADQLPLRKILVTASRHSNLMSSSSCHIPEIWCPLCRAVLKNTYDGGCGTISSPIAPPPPPSPYPPLGLLHVPHRARVTGVSNAHHEEMGGHLACPSAITGSLRT